MRTTSASASGSSPAHEAGHQAASISKRVGQRWQEGDARRNDEDTRIGPGSWALPKGRSSTEFGLKDGPGRPTVKPRGLAWSTRTGGRGDRPIETKGSHPWGGFGGMRTAKSRGCRNGGGRTHRRSPVARSGRARIGGPSRPYFENRPHWVAPGRGVQRRTASAKNISWAIGSVPGH